MKKNNLFKLTHIAWVMLMSFALISTSCTKDDDDDGEGTDPGEIVLDGTYLTGEATGLDGIDSKLTMMVGHEEGEGFASTEREGMWELFAYLTANKDFSMVTVDGATQTNYGSKDGTVATKVLDGINSQIHATIDTGMIVTDGAGMQVKEDGLYHIVVDLTSETYYVMPVNTFGIIGDATLNGWSGEIEMTEESLTAEAGKWTLSDIELRQGSFKFRYDNGWKVIASDYVLFSNIGTDGGSSWKMGGDGWSIAIEDQGIYDVTFDWSLADGFTYTTDKKGDIAVTDWSGVILDAVGDAISEENAEAVTDPSSWTWGNKLIADNGGEPSLDGTIYTWTWTNVALIENVGFKLRTENGEAPANGNGASFDVGYAAVDALASSENIVDLDGNISTSVAGNYDITVTIDADNGDTKTVKITEAGSVTPEMFIVGDGCAAGWDPANAVPMNGTGGVYTLTTDLVLGDDNGTPVDGNFKFITTLGQWAPMYGTDDGTETGGTLVFRETESDPDPGTIPVKVAGSYTITCDINNMTYTVVAAK